MYGEGPLQQRSKALLDYITNYIGAFPEAPLPRETLQTIQVSKNEISSLERINQDLATQLHNLQFRHRELEKQYNGLRDNQIEFWRSECASLTTRLREQDQQKREVRRLLQGTIRNLSDISQHQQAQLAQIRFAYQLLDDNHRQVRQQLILLRNRILDRLRVLRNEIMNIRQQVQRTRAHFNQVANQFQRIAQLMQRMELQRNGLRNQVGVLQQEHHHAIDFARKSSIERDFANNQLQRARDQIQQLRQMQQQERRLRLLAQQRLNNVRD